jgi:carbonic anhydrase
LLTRIEVLLENILPALDGLDQTLAPEALLGAAVEANVRFTSRCSSRRTEGRAWPKAC